MTLSFIFLKNFRRQRNNFHINCTKLASYGAKNTAATKLSSVVQQYTSIVVEADVRSICTTNFFLCANNQSFRYCTFFQFACRDDIFYSNDYNITDTCITTTRTTKHTDAKSLACAAVITYCKS